MPDDLWVYIYERGPVRMRDLEYEFVKTRKISRPTMYRYKKRLESEGNIQVQSMSGQPPYNTYSVPDHHQVIKLLLQDNPFPQITGTMHEDVPWEDGPKARALNVSSHTC